MTRSNLLFLAGGIFVLCIGIGSLFYVHESFDAPKSATESSQVADSYVRNVTWGTNFLKMSPYQKGNELEFLSVIDPTSFGGRVSFNLSRVLELFDNPELEINGKVTQIPSWPMETDIISSIKIRGKAKTDGKADTIRDRLIDTKLVQKIEQKTEEKSKLITESGTFSFTPSGTSYLSALSHAIVFSGTGAENIEQVLIGEKAFKWGLLSDWGYGISVERQTFPEWEYLVSFLLKNGTLVSSDINIHFLGKEAPIGIGAIVPNTVSNAVDSYVTLQGYGFSKLMSLQLGNGIVFKTASFTKASDNALLVKIPKGLAPGTYTINLMDTTGIFNAENVSFTITSP